MATAHLLAVDRKKAHTAKAMDRWAVVVVAAVASQNDCAGYSEECLVADPAYACPNSMAAFAAANAAVRGNTIAGVYSADSDESLDVVSNQLAFDKAAVRDCL